MNSFKNVFELIDISSSEEEEGEISERSSTPLLKKPASNYRIVLELSHSSTEAAIDEEEYLDISTDSLESSCKRLRLNLSLDTIDPQLCAPNTNQDRRQDEGLPDSPESPDESMCSDVFVVEEPASQSDSATSSRVLEYLEQVNQEDADSYFETPPGSPKKINFLPVSSLNDLDEPREVNSSNGPRTENNSMTFLPRLPGGGFNPRRPALSQPAPGLACGCRRVGIGRGHGCNARFPKWYFNY